ncbi:retrovirus-related Pol polyprotein from transposon opus [Trichonephila clavipes]|nr:retrovirus-related Pol polyprotein from transposon opus [Trichonephila clavipes]
MINFYRRYLKDAAKTQAPLHELLKGAKRKTAEKCIGLMTPGEASKNAKLTLPKLLFYHFKIWTTPITLHRCIRFCCGRSTPAIRKRACNIQHVLGKDNVVADALSRINSISEINFEEIAEEQTTDEELQKLLHNNSLKFKPSTLPSGKKLWCDISTQKIRPYIPQKFRFQIFQLIHGLAHPGIKSTVKLMTEKYVWSDIKKQVREWAKACIRCQKCKVSRHTKSKLGDFEQPDERFSVVHIDLIGKLPPSEGMQYCLTCIDRFSCWMEAIPIPEITAEIVGRAFYEKWILQV